MPIVNERCKILRSLNRVYIFEIVLLLVPRLKILRRRGLSYFGIIEKQEAQSSSQETNHNSFKGIRVITLAPHEVHPMHTSRRGYGTPGRDDLPHAARGTRGERGGTEKTDNPAPAPAPQTCRECRPHTNRALHPPRQ